MTTRISAREYWLALGLVTELSPRQRMQLLNGFGGPEGVCHWAKHSSQTIPQGLFLSTEVLERTKSQLRDFPFQKIEAELQRCRRLGAEILTPDQTDYPGGLKELVDFPAMLCVQGKNFREIFSNLFRVAVIGARKASPYGLMVTHSLTTALAKHGCIIVSGGARGIDACAHRACLSSGGRTVVVLGSGLGRIYPAEHRELFSKVSEEGVLVSEFPCQEGPKSYYFPQRNRIISALAKGVIVTQASIRSGSLITARQALDQGKEVMAVPGTIHEETCRGTNWLISQGAHLVSKAEDITEILGWQGFQEPSSGPVEQLSPACRKILREMGSTPLTREKIFYCTQSTTRLSLAAVSKILLDLENWGFIFALSGDRFLRTLSGSEVLWQDQ